ncbi:MAG: hypothetical protein RLZZ435_632 [Cyanobacteriota bacterium]|jgi:hypothetical protein
MDYHTLPLGVLLTSSPRNPATLMESLLGFPTSPPAQPSPAASTCWRPRAFLDIISTGALDQDGDRVPIAVRITKTPELPLIL